jgi:large subunit ribosomal protein L19
MTQKLAAIEKSLMKSELPAFEVGDHVSVGVKIREAPPPGSKDKEWKERIQNFIGDVIAIKGRGPGRNFTVRRIVAGEGVERVFPFHSPLVATVDVVRKGKVRRAKLYHLRGKSGKAARIREKTIDTDAASES